MDIILIFGIVAVQTGLLTVTVAVVDLIVYLADVRP